MRFLDPITLYPPVVTDLDDSQPDGRYPIRLKGLIELTSGLSRNGSYDITIGDAHAYLPANDPDLIALDYEVEGYYLRYQQKTYRINAVSIGKKLVTTGRSSHLEVALERVQKEPQL